MLQRFLEKLKALGQPTKICVAVSGGADSVALLRLCAQAGLQIVVAHLDHGIRPESRADVVFVRELCAGLGVVCITERVDVPSVAKARGWSLEDAARKVRYEFLSRVAKVHACDAVFTAHTQNDVAETVLAQLLRGTAKATGIPEQRKLGKAKKILRPLLWAQKTELENYLRSFGQTWVQDSSNEDVRFTRNWLRHKVLPLLETRFVGTSVALARYAQISQAENIFLDNLVAEVPASSDWRFEPLVLQRRLIYGALESAGVVANFQMVEFLRVALVATKVQRLSLPMNGADKLSVAVVQQGRVQILKTNQGVPDFIWPSEFDFSQFPAARMRTREAGDTIQLVGGTRKLSDVLIDKKIPRELRDGVPLVAQGQEVLWAGLPLPILDVRVGSVLNVDVLAMKEALGLAEEAFDDDEVPVGAVVMQQGKIVGRGRNRSKKNNDMTLHAELEALRDATKNLGTAFLTDCSLVVTLEPCPMCFGAAIESRVSGVVFGASNPKSGALGGVRDISRAAWSHRPVLRAGVLEKQAAVLLEDFFKKLRNA